MDRPANPACEVVLVHSSDLHVDEDRNLASGGGDDTAGLRSVMATAHIDQLLAGVEGLVPDGSVKLGFRTHYPQIETKLIVRGADMDDIERKLAPVQAEVRRRLGNFILGEDDQTLAACRT